MVRSALLPAWCVTLLALLTGCAVVKPRLHHALPEEPTERIELPGVAWRFKGETEVDGETLRFKRLASADTLWLPMFQRSQTRLSIEGADGQPALRCEGRGARIQVISFQARKPMVVKCQIGTRFEMQLEEDQARGQFEKSWRGQIAAVADGSNVWRLHSLHGTKHGTLDRPLGFSIWGDGRLLAVVDRSGSRPVLTLSRSGAIDRDRLLSASLALALLELPDPS